ncbi:rhomboid family intramembrane serine protease [Ktedonosporobacter rubrisoli]|uniref:Rhomboid family intramembrane serine protease n=1 Tax=Ktedonosporobacter rubrisoli TaxID=2509675 RepID=A0A4P6JU70_KTERU|nr:rhomboid family intramembrane serine protease [Ktedonosporobacter rubrisoli]QBD79157.1 rhomboid family intramembrane serine protease [Ktedonosporobacter rubrisoli]
MYKIQRASDAATRRLQTRLSYQAAVEQHRRQRGLGRISWGTWTITLITVLLWCFTAYQVALSAGAHGWQAIISDIVKNAIDIQDKDNVALSSVLIAYGAKDNGLMIHGQYWRFITPIFLHVNALHLGLNMLNLIALGIFVERVVGHVRFLLIYLVTGVVSIVASFYFAPQDISVGHPGLYLAWLGLIVFLFFPTAGPFVAREFLPCSGWLLWLVLT